MQRIVLGGVNLLNAASPISTVAVKVFLAWEPEEWEIGLWRGRLEALGASIAWPSKEPEGYREAEVLVMAPPPPWLREAVNARFIQTISAGVDPRILGFAAKRGIKVASAKGCNAAAVAEMVFAHILALEKRIVELDSSMKRGEWVPYRRSTMLGDLLGKTMLIVGFGNIGLEVARRAEAFGIKVLAVARRPGVRGKWVVRPVDELEKMVGLADYIVVTLPLTEDTRGLIGRRVLSRAKKGAILVNVGRGPVVDEDALSEALDEGRLRAGLDVWWSYPPSRDAPSRRGLHRHPAVLATPHKAGWTPLSKKRCVEFAASNVARFLRGKQPLNLVGAQGY